jgi:hypothetical protein
VIGLSLVEKIGLAVSLVGFNGMMLLVSTDDFYVMELRQPHEMNYLAFFLWIIVMAFGAWILRVGEIRRRNHMRRGKRKRRIHKSIDRH